MKRLFISGMIVGFVWFCINLAYAGATRTVPSSPQNGTKVNPSVKSPADQTDTYAIPLDSSEMEEKEEEKELEKEQKALQKKYNRSSFK